MSLENLDPDEVLVGESWVDDKSRLQMVAKDTCHIFDAVLPQSACSDHAVPT